MRGFRVPAFAGIVVLLLLLLILFLGGRQWTSSESLVDGGNRDDSTRLDNSTRLGVQLNQAEDVDRLPRAVTDRQGEAALLPPSTEEEDSIEPGDTALATWKVAYLDQRAPPMGLAWNAAPAECHRVLNDPQAGWHLQVEARRRLLVREWQGRDDPYLGGFTFDPADYPELQGLSATTPSRTWVEVNPTRIPDGTLDVRVRRNALFEGEDIRVAISVIVFPSRQWAQRELAKELGGQMPSLPLVGDAEVRVVPEHHNFIKLSFTRHNVLVQIEARRGLTLTDVESLAVRMDQNIRAQSVRAATWEGLADHTPKIERFQTQPAEIVMVEGGNGAKIDLKVLAPGGEPLSYYVFAESPAGVSSTRSADGWVRVNMRNADSIVSDTTCRVWAVAYLPNLLFTVAETTILVKPAPDDG